MLAIIGMLALVICASIFSSCTQDEYLPETNQTEEFQANDQITSETRSMSTTYYYQPTKGGGYVASNTSNDHVGGYWANGTFVSHTGGAITARVLNITGEGNHELTVRISKPGGGNFSSGGLAYVKMFAPTGPVASNSNGVPYYSGNSYVDVHVDLDSLGIDLSYGYLNLYPTINVGSDRYYAEPVLVYTQPMYNNASFAVGVTLGLANNVHVYGNDAYDNKDINNYYQCIEFCRRYYNNVYHKDIGTVNGYAKNLYSLAPGKNLASYANGNSSTTGAPRPGDILVLDGGHVNPDTGISYGHVAVIMQVGSGFIKIAQQNSGVGNPSSTNWNNPIGGQLSRNGNTISAPANTTYSVLGWVRIIEQ